jgi:hypothetical protein
MKKILIIIILLLSFNTAFSTVLFETGIGFSQGSFEYLGTSVKGDFKGLYLNARLCHNFDSGVFLGIDLRSYSLLNTVDGESNFEASLLNTSRGFVIGFTPGKRLRLWFSYQFINSFDMPESSTTTFNLVDGKGFIAGIGYMGIPWVSINLEYASYYFDEYKDGGLYSLSNDYSFQTFLISFSFPIDM